MYSGVKAVASRSRAELLYGSATIGDQSTQVSFPWKDVDSYIAVRAGARRKRKNNPLLARG